ncbi:hypothetical protein V6N13_022966 [Hibiscus sabdariffa]|uniref:Uncharacterized protein n=2 Tax=Hibiscus sabdariffa TaxID=183260 RepID=A0ABR2NU02_9ROSI
MATQREVNMIVDALAQLAWNHSYGSYEYTQPHASCLHLYHANSLDSSVVASLGRPSDLVVDGVLSSGVVVDVNSSDRGMDLEMSTPEVPSTGGGMVKMGEASTESNMVVVTDMAQL